MRIFHRQKYNREFQTFRFVNGHQLNGINVFRSLNARIFAFFFPKIKKIFQSCTRILRVIVEQFQKIEQEIGFFIFHRKFVDVIFYKIVQIKMRKIFLFQRNSIFFFDEDFNIFFVFDV